MQSFALIGRLAAWSAALAVPAALAIPAAALGFGPGGAPAAPQLTHVQLVGKVLVVSEIQFEFHEESILQKIKVRDEQGQVREEEQPVTIQRLRPIVAERGVSERDFRIVTLAGQPVDLATAAEKLGEPALALVSETGKRVDPALLEIYQPDVLLIYLRPRPPEHGCYALAAPPQAMPAQAPPAPAPQITPAQAPPAPAP